MRDLEESEKLFGADTSSQHIQLAENAQYPPELFDKTTGDIFCKLSSKEPDIAEATLREAKRSEDVHEVALQAWFKRELITRRKSQRTTMASLVQESQNHWRIQICIHKAKANGTWENIKHMVKNHRNRNGEIGQRMMSITWVAPVEEKAEFAGSNSTGSTELVEELLAGGTDIVSKDTEPIPCSDSQTISQIKVSCGDESAAPVEVSEEREGELRNDEVVANLRSATDL